MATIAALMEMIFCERDKSLDLLVTALTADKTNELDSIYNEEEEEILWYFITKIASADAIEDKSRLHTRCMIVVCACTHVGHIWQVLSLLFQRYMGSAR